MSCPLQQWRERTGKRGGESGGRYKRIGAMGEGSEEEGSGRPGRRVRGRRGEGRERDER